LAYLGAARFRGGAFFGYMLASDDPSGAVARGGGLPRWATGARGDARAKQAL